MSREYINESLIHWTGREKTEGEAFGILETICKEQILRLSYCPNYMDEKYRQDSGMVCFTEIPLRFSSEHCKIFGKFGIAFSKSAMIKYGANPVLYTTDKHFEQIKHLGTLLSRMKDLEKDREWKEELEPYRFNQDETLALLRVMEFLQEYLHKGQSEHITYYQREWRLAVNSLPFEGDTNAHAPGKIKLFIRDGVFFHIFKFKKTDVDYLVVPNNYLSLAKFLGTTLGCKIKCYEKEVDSTPTVEKTCRSFDKPLISDFTKKSRE